MSMDLLLTLERKKKNLNYGFFDMPKNIIKICIVFKIYFVCLILFLDKVTDIISFYLVFNFINIEHVN